MYITKGNRIMQILKIDNNQGTFSLDGINFIVIDKITKENILALIDIVLNSDEIIMDTYEESNLGNKAHQIIYRSIYGKLTELRSHKDAFQDECSAMYKAALEKYDS